MAVREEVAARTGAQELTQLEKEDVTGEEGAVVGDLLGHLAAR